MHVCSLSWYIEHHTVVNSCSGDAPHPGEASSPVIKEDTFLCCTCLSSFIVCTCELCEIDVKSSNECIFLPHVYRASSVQWAVCTKANVLIYKWLTLGKIWCCAFLLPRCSLQGVDSQAHPRCHCSAEEATPKEGFGRLRLRPDPWWLLVCCGMSHPFLRLFTCQVSTSLSWTLWQALEGAVGTKTGTGACSAKARLLCS